jgi:hypothetical protein
LIDGSIEPWGDVFIIKSKSRLDLGFLENPPFKGKIDSKEKAFKIFNLISDGSVSDLHYSVKPNQDRMTSYGSMNRKIIEILKRKKYDSIVMKIRDDDSLHAGFASEHRTVFDPSQIKLADPVTYDSNGKVIPLSKRFNTQSDKITENIHLNILHKLYKPINKLRHNSIELFESESRLSLAYNAFIDEGGQIEKTKGRYGEVIDLHTGDGKHTFSVNSWETCSDTSDEYEDKEVLSHEHGMVTYRKSKVQMDKDILFELESYLKKKTFMRKFV